MLWTAPKFSNSWVRGGMTLLVEKSVVEIGVKSSFS
jgi:hypothetical protein